MSDYKDNRTEETKQADKEQIIPPHLDYKDTSSASEEKTAEDEDSEDEKDLPEKEELD